MSEHNQLQGDGIGELEPEGHAVSKMGSKTEDTTMPKKQAWDVDVDVYLISDNPLQFKIESYLQAGSSADPIVFHNNGHPGFNVNFHLHDETGLGYRFPAPPNKKDAVWSRLGTGNCPAEPGVWEVFDQNGIDVKDHGETAVAFNRNPEPAQGDFTYTLNVSKDGNRPYLPLDPVGSNQNGSS